MNSTTSSMPTTILPAGAEEVRVVPFSEMFFTLVLFLLPIVLLIIHSVFTSKYWKNSGIVFKILDLLVFAPLIFMSYGSIAQFAQYGLVDSMAALIHYIAIPYVYPPIILFWVIVFWKQRKNKNMTSGN